MAWQKQLLCEQPLQLTLARLSLLSLWIGHQRRLRACSTSSRGTRAITQITLRITLELHLNAEVSANIVTIFTAKWHFLNYNVTTET